MRGALFSLLVLMLVASPAAAQDTARMEAIVRTDADRGEFMGAVLVARDGVILFDRGYGSANLEWKTANDGDTKFRLGSLTKQFTAVSVLLLVERGKLSLDAPIKTWLPDAPAAWDKVTIRHLLSHTAGVPSLTAFPDYEQLKTLPTTLEAVVARFRDKPLEFEPGAKWSYSNSGYILLTAIIEKASGQRYADFLADNIFKPLGMADSGYDSHAAIIAHRASGYSAGANGMVNADYIEMAIPQGAGGLYSTTHDLLRWQAGLYGGRLLKPASLAALTTPVMNNYAFGIGVTRDASGTLYAHGGGIEGFNTWLGYDPERHITVVVLANLSGRAPNRLGASLMTLARGGTVTLAAERVEVALPPEALAAYAGTYDVSPEFSFVVRVEGGRLIVQATGQGPLLLHAEKPDHFFLKEVDAQLVFRRDASGAIDAVTLFQNGRQTLAKRR
ncbi:serine hydrolase [Sphingomonas sp. LB-2]|uniref:serine hydrolase n=1 Tax=Sphingomonas caeni TaxID=2984949 RepID=UPI00223297D4|nr:serine hydrolase [Sphingomonas caeni]MCW3847212.1 serine hydrolase [Sphingomonas caeni]